MPFIDLGNLGVEGGVHVLFKTCCILRCLLDPQVDNRHASLKLWVEIRAFWLIWNLTRLHREGTESTGGYLLTSLLEFHYSNTSYRYAKIRIICPGNLCKSGVSGALGRNSPRGRLRRGVKAMSKETGG